MVSPKLKYYGLFFSLPKTRKSFATRLSLLNFIKEWISNIESVPDRKLTMKYKTIILSSKAVYVYFDAQEVFTFYIASQEESLFDSVNLISNEVLNKFNQGNFPEVKSEISLKVATLFTLPKKSNLFSKLIQTDFLKNIECPFENAETARIDFVCNKETNQRVRFSLNSENKQNNLGVYLFRDYQNQIPTNVMKDLVCITKQNAELLVESVIEEQ